MQEAGKVDGVLYQGKCVHRGLIFLVGTDEGRMPLEHFSAELGVNNVLGQS